MSSPTRDSTYDGDIDRSPQRPSAPPKSTVPPAAVAGDAAAATAKKIENYEENNNNASSEKQKKTSAEPGDKDDEPGPEVFSVARISDTLRRQVQLLVRSGLSLSKLPVIGFDMAGREILRGPKVARLVAKALGNVVRLAHFFECAPKHAFLTRPFLAAYAFAVFPVQTEIYWEGPEDTQDPLHREAVHAAKELCSSFEHTVARFAAIPQQQQQQQPISQTQSSGGSDAGGSVAGAGVDQLVKKHIAELAHHWDVYSNYLILLKSDQNENLSQSSENARKLESMYQVLALIQSRDEQAAIERDIAAARTALIGEVGRDRAELFISRLSVKSRMTRAVWENAVKNSPRPSQVSSQESGSEREDIEESPLSRRSTTTTTATTTATTTTNSTSRASAPAPPQSPSAQPAPPAQQTPPAQQSPSAQPMQPQTTPSGPMPREVIEALVSKWKIAHRILNGDEVIPADSGMVASYKATFKQAFWDAVKYRLSTGTATSPESQREIADLILEMRGALLGIVPANSQIAQELSARIDPQLIEQHLRAGAFERQEIIGAMSVLAMNVRSLEAPGRDAEFDQWWADVSSRAATAPVHELFPDALRRLWEMIEQIKLDIANYQIDQIRQLVARNGVNYERTVFSRLLDLGAFTLNRTNAWLRRVRSWTQASAAAALAGRQYEAGNVANNSVYFEVVVRNAFAMLLASQTPVSPTDAPETLQLDLQRVFDIQNLGQEIALIAALVSLASQTCSKAGAPMTRENVLSFKQATQIIVRSPDTNLAALASHLSGYVTRFLAEHGKTIAPEEVSLLATQVSVVTSLENPVFRLIHSRLTDAIVSATQDAPRDSAPPAFVSDRAGGAGTGAAAAALHPSLELFGPEVSVLKDKVSKLVKNNLDSFMPFYITQLTRIMNEPQNSAQQ